MIDRELEQQLARYFRAEVGSEGASPRLLARVSAIPESAAPSPFAARRGFFLLVAAALLMALLAGAAIAAGTGLIDLPWESEKDETPATVEVLHPMLAASTVRKRLYAGTRYVAAVGSPTGKVVIGFKPPVGTSPWEWSESAGGQLGQLSLDREGGWVMVGLPSGIYADPCHRLAGTAVVQGGAAAFAGALQQVLAKVPGIRVEAAPDIQIGTMPTPGLKITVEDPSRLPACDEYKLLLWSDASDSNGIAPNDNPGHRGIADGSWDSWWPDAITVRLAEVGGSIVLIESSADHTNSEAVTGVEALIDSIEWPDPASVHAEAAVPFREPPCTVDQVRPNPLQHCYLRPATPYRISLGNRSPVQVEFAVPAPVTYQLTVDRDVVVMKDRVTSVVVDLVTTQDGPDLSVHFPNLGISCVTGVQVAGGDTSADAVTAALTVALAERPETSVGLSSTTQIGGLPALELRARLDTHAGEVADFCKDSSPRFVSEEYYVIDLDGRVVVVLAQYDGEEAGMPAAVSEILDSLTWR